MIHTTALTRPVQKKYVPVNVTLKGSDITLPGLLEYVGGAYDASVSIMDHVVEGWGQRLGEAQADLNQKAQAYIDGMGLRDGKLQETYA